MHTIFYISLTCFGGIWQSSGSWHQNIFRTYSNKMRHNKRALTLTVTILLTFIKLQNTTFDGVTWVFLFIIKHGINNVKPFDVCNLMCTRKTLGVITKINRKGATDGVCMGKIRIGNKISVRKRTERDNVCNWSVHNFRYSKTSMNVLTSRIYTWSSYRNLQL